MAKKTNVADEIKALGIEVASALKQIGSSKEFQALEKDIAAGVKKVSASLLKSLKAANKSKSADRIKNRLGRVVKVGAVQGGEEAQKASKAVKGGLKKINKAFRKLAKKLDDN